MKTRLEKAIEYIRGFCNKHDECEKCRLQDKETQICRLKDAIPCEWEDLPHA